MLQYVINGLPIGAIYALIALSYSFIYASTGFLNWAQGDMVMLGAYIGFTVYKMLHLGFVPVILSAATISGLAGMLVYFLVLKPLQKKHAPPINVIIATLGVAIIIRNLALLIWGPDAQLFPSPVSTRPITEGAISITPLDTLILIVGIIIMGFFQYMLKRTKEGKASRAVAQDRYAALLMGINTERSDSMALAISAAMGGAAGILIAPIFFVTFNMGASVGLKGFVAAVIGGLGSVPGAIAGGFFMGVIESVAGGLISSGYRDAITFTILILVLWLKPSGLFLRKKKQKV